jgi:hypothetical protein
LENIQNKLSSEHLEFISNAPLPTMSVSCPSLAGRVVAGVDSAGKPS